MSKRLSKQQKQAKRQKNKDKSARKRKTESRRAMADLITRLGLMDTFTQCPKNVQDFILSSRNPSPKIILAEDSEEDLDLTSFTAQMEKWSRPPLLQLDNWPFRISINDYFRNTVPLLLFYKKLKRTCYGRTDQPPFLDAAKPFLDDDAKMFEEVMETMESGCRALSYKATQFDQRIVTWDMSYADADFPKQPLILSFRVTKPTVKYVMADGRRRKSYHVGCPLHGHMIRWHELETSVLGLSSEERVPVYVQSHLIDRLRSRLQPNGAITYSFTVFHYSVGSPHVVREQSGVIWLEAKSVTGRRVGYFLVELVDGVALVKTFLFLTMKGTPESERLYEMLGARRDDIEHLELDELETFMKPDVIKDKELAEIFKKCGCGQLLELHTEFLFDYESDGDAEAIKAYLAPSKALAELRQAPQGIRAADLNLPKFDS